MYSSSDDILVVHLSAKLSSPASQDDGGDDWGSLICSSKGRLCGRTVCTGCNCDDDGQRPVKDEGENDERNDNVDESGNDIEQDKL